MDPIYEFQDIYDYVPSSVELAELYLMTGETAKLSKALKSIPDPIPNTLLNKIIDNLYRMCAIGQDSPKHISFLASFIFTRVEKCKPGFTDKMMRSLYGLEHYEAIMKLSKIKIGSSISFSPIEAELIMLTYEKTGNYKYIFPFTKVLMRATQENYTRATFESFGRSCYQYIFDLTAQEINVMDYVTCDVICSVIFYLRTSTSLSPISYPLKKNLIWCLKRVTKVRANDRFWEFILRDVPPYEMYLNQGLARFELTTLVDKHKARSMAYELYEEEGFDVQSVYFPVNLMLLSFLDSNQFREKYFEDLQEKGDFEHNYPWPLSLMRDVFVENGDIKGLEAVTDQMKRLKVFTPGRPFIIDKILCLAKKDRKQALSLLKATVKDWKPNREDFLQLVEFANGTDWEFYRGLVELESEFKMNAFDEETRKLNEICYHYSLNNFEKVVELYNQNIKPNNYYLPGKVAFYVILAMQELGLHHQAVEVFNSDRYVWQLRKSKKLLRRLLFHMLTSFEEIKDIRGYNDAIDSMLICKRATDDFDDMYKW